MYIYIFLNIIVIILRLFRPDRLIYLKLFVVSECLSIRVSVCWSNAAAAVYPVRPLSGGIRMIDRRSIPAIPTTPWPPVSTSQAYISRYSLVLSLSLSLSFSLFISLSFAIPFFFLS